jgi:hypothetical protein
LAIDGPNFSTAGTHQQFDFCHFLEKRAFAAKAGCPARRRLPAFHHDTHPRHFRGFDNFFR